MNNKEILEKDNRQTARFGGKEVCIKVVSLRTETFYKADAMGKVAGHAEARSSVVEVKSGVVQRKFMCLRCGCRSISSLINQTAVSEENGAPQDRVIMLQHDCS